MVVWKFKLLPGLRILWMPKDAIVISAAAQSDDAVVYVLCDPEAESEERAFRSMPTGNENVDGIEDWDFIDTVHCDNGLVFHVFCQ